EVVRADRVEALVHLPLTAAGGRGPSDPAARSAAGPAGTAAAADRIRPPEGAPGPGLPATARPVDGRATAGGGAPPARGPRADRVPRSPTDQLHGGTE
ncbi:hypothetical protein ABT329_05205, partial [Streptomyces minutiscleroticus]